VKTSKWLSGGFGATWPRNFALTHRWAVAIASGDCAPQKGVVPRRMAAKRVRQCARFGNEKNMIKRSFRITSWIEGWKDRSSRLGKKPSWDF
jgi:hypothetical protein